MRGPFHEVGLKKKKKHREAKTPFRWRQLHKLLPTIILFSLLFSFYQSCGPGFKVADFQPLSLSSSADIDFHVRDIFSASEQYTRSNSVNVLMSGFTIGKSICLSEAQNLAPMFPGSCLGGQGSSQGWSTTVPAAFNLSSGDGVKRVYLWWADSEDGVDGGATREIYLDTVIPTVTGNPAPPAAQNTNTISLDFTAADNASGITRTECRYDNGLFGPCTSGFTRTSVPQGSHMVEVRTYDGAGNTATVPFNIVVDQTRPSVAVLPTAPSPTAATVNFSFNPADTLSGIAASRTRCIFDGNSTSCTNTFDANCAIGMHSFRVHVEDNAGNTFDSPAVTWTTDFGPSSVIIAITNPTIPANAFSALDTFTFSFTSTPAAISYRCQLDTQTETNCSTGSRLSYNNLQTGPHTVAVRGLDANGNIIGSASHSWQTDRTAPTIAVSPVSPSTTASMISFTFNPADAGSSVATVTCIFDSIEGACTTNTSFNTPTLNNGNHSFRARVLDQAGNETFSNLVSWTTNIAPSSVTVGITSPSIPSGTVTNQTSFSATLTSSTTNSAVTYTCEITGSAESPCPIGSYSRTGLVTAATTFTVRARDSANSIIGTISHSWTVDTIAPTVTASPMSPSPLSNSVTFSFNPADVGSSVALVRCIIDGVEGACGSNTNHTMTVADGPHSFQIRVRDLAGNQTLSNLVNWTTVLEPGSVVIAIAGSIPSNSLTNNSSFNGTFTSTPAATSYTCQRDNLAAVSCTPSTNLNYSGLTTQQHSLVARAFNSSNTQIGTATYTWTVDVTPPTVAVTPASPSTSASSVTFTFNPADVGSSVAQVRCYVNGTEGNCNTNTSHTMNVSNGPQTFRVRVDDQAGNQSFSNLVSWTTDIAPTSVTVAITSPSIPSGGITNQTSFSSTLTSSSTSGLITYTCEITGSPETPCPIGNYSRTGLTTGATTLTIRAKNSSSVVVGSASHSWTVDTAAPTVAVTPTSPSTSATSVTFSFNPADVGSSVALVRCIVDSVEVACNSNTSHTMSGLTSAAHSFQVRVVDQASNQALSNRVAWTSNPEPTIVMVAINLPSIPAGAVTNQTNFSATLTSNTTHPSVTYTCEVTGSSESACPMGAFSRSGFSGGNSVGMILIVRARNSSNAIIGSATHTWTIDTVAPTLTWTSLPTNPNNASSASLTYTISESATVTCAINLGATVNGYTATACTVGNLTTNTYTVTITMTDSAGNLRSTPYTWTVDRTPPAIVITSRPSSPTNATSLSFQFVTSPAEAANFYCSSNNSSWTNCPGSYSFPSINGTNIFQVYALDSLGNQSPSTTEYASVVLDPPVVTMASAPASPSVSPNVTFNGSCGTATSVQICVNRNGHCNYPADFNYSTACTGGAYSFATSLNAGIYLVRSSGGDQYGLRGYSSPMQFEVSGTVYFSEILQGPVEHPDGRVPLLHDFDTYIQVANDNNFAVTYDLYFHDAIGNTVPQAQACAAFSRCTFPTANIPSGYYGVEISPRCSGTCPKIYVHRSTYFKGFPDLYTGEPLFTDIWDASHDNNAITSPGTHFNFPEGGTTGWPGIYKIYNPQNIPVNITFNLYALATDTSDPGFLGTTFAGSQTFTIAPKSVFRMVLQDTMPFRNATISYYKDFASTIDSTAPVVIEQSLYEPTYVGAGGQSSVGEQNTAVEWYFPATETFDMHTRVYIFNPNPTPTTVLIYYWFGSGIAVRGNTQVLTIGAYSRRNFDLLVDGPGVIARSPLGPGDTGISVKSVINGTNTPNTAAPITVSKNEYWPFLTDGHGWVEGTQSFGSSTNHTAWIIPGGTCSGRQPGADNDRSFYHFVDIINSSGENPNPVNIVLYRDNGTTYQIPPFLLAGYVHKRIRIQDYGITGDYYVKVTSTYPINVETTIMTDWDNNFNYQWRTGEQSPAIPMN
jgi:hypothetical protein